MPEAERFADALSRIHVTELQRRMLELHYQAPARILTAGQMAEALGYTHHSAANAPYGTLGKKLAGALDWQPANSLLGVAVLNTFTKPDSHWRWHMRPELATGLELLGWVTPSMSALPDEIDDATTYVEGATKRTTVNAYERSPAARAKCIEVYGYTCAVCGMMMSYKYGVLGEQYVHVHHLRQLSELSAAKEVDPSRDLRPVCPNCHAMIHRRSPPFSVEEIQERIKQKNSTVLHPHW